MKVALFTNGIYPFAMGGMQKHSYYLARYLARRGVGVDVYHYKSQELKNRDISHFFSRDELNMITFKTFDFPTSIYFPGHFVFNLYRYSRKIYKHLLKNISDVDFIYVQGMIGWKLMQEKNKSQKMPPVGLNFHGLEMFQMAADKRSGLEKLLYFFPARFCLKRADIVISLGGKLTAILENKVQTSAEIWEIPIGIEKKWLATAPSAPNKRRRFIFVGRYERRKGIQELNETIKKISSDHDFEFEFIGPIPEKYRLPLSNCQYYGAVYDEDEVIRLLSKADILVCPSYSEGMPTVILEAMARGLAVVATDVGAVGELVSPETGWLINLASISALNEALIAAIRTSDKNLQRKKGKALKRVKQHFTWDKVIDLTLDKIKGQV